MNFNQYFSKEQFIDILKLSPQASNGYGLAGFYKSINDVFLVSLTTYLRDLHSNDNRSPPVDRGMALSFKKEFIGVINGDGSFSGSIDLKTVFATAYIDLFFVDEPTNAAIESAYNRLTSKVTKGDFSADEVAISDESALSGKTVVYSFEDWKIASRNVLLSLKRHP